MNFMPKKSMCFKPQNSIEPWEILENWKSFSLKIPEKKYSMSFKGATSGAPIPNIFERKPIWA